MVVTTNFDVDSFVKGYHEDKSICEPKIGEVLSTERKTRKLGVYVRGLCKERK